MKFKLIEDINRGHEEVSSNELLDDIVYKSDNNIYEQTSKQALANRKTKEEFIKLSKEADMLIDLPTGSVVHHLEDSVMDNGLKDNSWNNIIIISGLPNNKSYGELLHRFITCYDKYYSEITVEQFTKLLLNSTVYMYDEINNKVDELTVSKFLERRNDK